LSTLITDTNNYTVAILNVCKRTKILFFIQLRVRVKNIFKNLTNTYYTSDMTHPLDILTKHLQGFVSGPLGDMSIEVGYLMSMQVFIGG
jgi:hypothetical protein